MSATGIIQPKTRRGRRLLESRAPKLIEDTRRSMIISGHKVNQTIKDVLTDLHKLKGVDSLRMSRKNDVLPFEAGGDVWLESHGSRANCSLFAVGTHSKKRPNNLVLGRLYDFRMYDMIEFGVKGFAPIQAFSGARSSQLGNKPAFVFAGDGFESDAVLRRVKSMFLDFFRGRQVDALNLKGLDRVVFVTCLPGSKTIVFRQYSVKLKRSGTKVPRVELEIMGPSLDLEVRRTREPAADLEKEAMKQPKLTRTKEKNVATDALEGRVGRIYMPPQNIDTIALHKSKGLKKRKDAPEGAGGAEANGQKKRA
ncbi:Ribosome production factor 2-like protein [Auxenochlorella protothecoides]|uniref:Ribosome production factor 2 homolog n=1 Tax=Auxenochlorella protothecoides TaxID=3075 RepID=A0A087SFU6_AUXPR|nr:Ribosome production factor 2-like protein [Auxenochlorella protothecoides]KFM24600.1 Ribosome production factor 2-like protein [Auxenochlorella protothecoides]